MAVGHELGNRAAKMPLPERVTRQSQYSFIEWTNRGGPQSVHVVTTHHARSSCERPVTKFSDAPGNASDTYVNEAWS